MIGNNKNDQFEAYLKGSLSGDERAAFEEELRSDQSVSIAFEEFKAIFNLVNVAGENELKGVLDQIHKEIESDKEGSSSGNVVPIHRRKGAAVAASIIILFGLIFFFNSRSSNSDKLYAENIAPYELPDRTRSDSDETDPWQQFSTLYSTQNFEEALDALQNVPEERMPEYLVSLYRGICLQLSSSPDLEGSVIALEITLASDNDFHSVAHWYAGLAALKLNELNKATKHFEKVVDQKGFKQKEAESLLQEIADL